jgi:hypothetical protein
MWHHNDSSPSVFILFYFFKTRYLVQGPTNLRGQSHDLLAGAPLKLEFFYSVWISPLKLTLGKIEPKTLRIANSKDPSQRY